ALSARTVPLASLGRGEVKFRGCLPGVTTCTTANSQVITLTPAQLNSFYPAVGLNPAALAVLAGAASRYPANSAGGDTLNTSGFRFNAPVRTELNGHQVRFDFNLNRSGSQQLFLRGSYQNDNLPVSTANPQQFPDTPVRTRWSHPLGYVAGHTWAIDGHKTNVFRYGLTRLALSDQGDTTGNDIFFRFVFNPTLAAFTFSRINPVHTITDDFSWIAGDHSMQFGTNIRIVRNKRFEFAPGFDQALTNPFFYESSGNVLISPITAAGFTITSNQDDLKSALTAVIGRFSQYTARFNFGIDGQPLASGEPAVRNFATEEYDVYAQDSWKLSPNLTLTFGLRYGLSKPVYEKQGFMTTTNIPLGEYLRRRIENAYNGVNYVEPIIVNKSDRLYNWDKNNFQPRVAVAWSPDAGENWFGRFVGRNGKSVIRSGFAITNDYFGNQLAVTFNSQNTLGFASSQTTPANTFNITTNPAPLFTGFGQDVRSLPTIVVPGALTFPQQRSSNNARRIESSLDSHQVSPINYSWNVSYERDLPGGMVIETAYVARIARNLLAGRDAVQTNLNFRDPVSGQTWQEVATVLEGLRRNATPIGQVASIPYFDNIYTPGSLATAFGSAYAGLTNTQVVYRRALVADGNDWTTTQDVLDARSGRRLFYQPQYGALAVYSTIGTSDFHGATVSIRQRYKTILTYDLNYTLSKSLDDVSGLQVDAPFTPFILNALDQKQQRAVSDFDVRHVINANAIYQLPFGRGRTFLSDAPSIVNGIIGGWQLSSIFRWNSGLPVEAPLDFGGWPTNWNRRNYITRISPIEASPTRGGSTPANLFSDPEAAFHSFRSGEPGERGDRNIFRYPGFVTLDLGIYKSFGMPWSEGHKLSIRWDVFNVTNTQRLTSVDGFVIALDPFKPSATPNGTFGNFTSIQGSPRVMQVGMRYTF
ncbi:MAG TPA: TonB-dependent receptor, partial [Pyrinomonadaceae bacterium]